MPGGSGAGSSASLALARSLDREQDGALPEARAALTDAFDGNVEEVEEIEDLLANAVRLAAGTGDLGTAQALAGHAAALAAGSKIPHRLANALYCRGLLDRDAARLLVAAERYDDASRPLLRAKALEAAAGYFVDADDRGQARAAFTAAVEVYTALARPRTSPGCRPRSAPTASGAGRTPSTGGRKAAGKASPRPRSRSPRSWRRDCPTRRSPPGCCYPAGPSRRTSPTSSRSSMSTRESILPEKVGAAQHHAEVTRRAREDAPWNPAAGRGVPGASSGDCEAPG